jgi:hypothetical protein
VRVPEVTHPALTRRRTEIFPAILIVGLEPTGWPKLIRSEDRALFGNAAHNSNHRIAIGIFDPSQYAQAPTMAAQTAKPSAAANGFALVPHTCRSLGQHRWAVETGAVKFGSSLSSQLRGKGTGTASHLSVDFRTPGLPKLLKLRFQGLALS